MVTSRLICRALAGPARQSGAARSARALHQSSVQHAITKFQMPAMSPTMTEGGLANWKVKEGQSFSAGDVLLEIETDKATMDVEAQDDGIMAKIVVDAGAKAVPVGKTIAMLAEEGDDISNVEVPKEDESSAAAAEAKPAEQAKPEPAKEASSSSSAPASSASSSSGHAHGPPDLGRPQFPSVNRLLLENNISAQDARKIKGTGLHQMITKGDVLAYLGKASSPTGSFKPPKNGIAALGGGAAAPKKQSEPLTAADVRSLIFAGLAAGSHATRAKELASRPTTSAAAALSSASGSGPARSAFDELLDDYEFGARNEVRGTAQGARKDSFEGLL